MTRTCVCIQVLNALRTNRGRGGTRNRHIHGAAVAVPSRVYDRIKSTATWRSRVVPEHLPSERLLWSGRAVRHASVISERVSTDATQIVDNIARITNAGRFSSNITQTDFSGIVIVTEILKSSSITYVFRRRWWFINVDIVPVCCYTRLIASVFVGVPFCFRYSLETTARVVFSFRFVSFAFTSFHRVFSPVQ